MSKTCNPVYRILKFDYVDNYILDDSNRTILSYRKLWLAYKLEYKACYYNYLFFEIQVWTKIWEIEFVLADVYDKKWKNLGEKNSNFRIL